MSAYTPEELTRRVQELTEDLNKLVTRELFEEKVNTFLGKQAELNVNQGKFETRVDKNLDEIKEEQRFSRRLLVTNIIALLVSIATGVVVWAITVA